MVKNPPANAGSILGQEDPLEEGMATHCSILVWRTPKDRGACQATVHGVTKSQTQLITKHTLDVLYLRRINLTLTQEKWYRSKTKGIAILHITVSLPLRDTNLHKIP